MILHTARPSDLDAPTLYALLKLRSDVFVVEQACPYAELDGCDLEAGTEHRWFADADGPSAYVRLLAEPDGTTRLGRVVTRPDARGAGLARALVEGVLADHDGPVRADAQAHLVAWYEALGFQVTGPEYLEDGIPHVPCAGTDPPGARSSGHDRQKGHPCAGQEPSTSKVTGVSVRPGQAMTASPVQRGRTPLGADPSRPRQVSATGS